MPELRSVARSGPGSRAAEDSDAIYGARNARRADASCEDGQEKGGLVVATKLGISGRCAATPDVRKKAQITYFVAVIDRRQTILNKRDFVIELNFPAAQSRLEITEQLEEFIPLPKDADGADTGKGIAEGVENSNFLLRTERGTFILTLYEKRVLPQDLPFFIALMEHLAGHGIACPTPVKARGGVALRSLLPQRATGGHHLPSFGACGRAASCRSIAQGSAARSPGYLAGSGFACAGQGKPFGRGVATAFRRPARRAPVKPSRAEELGQELADLEQRWPADLPMGTIHADLFPDSVFFRGEVVSGLIDFLASPARISWPALSRSASSVVR